MMKSLCLAATSLAALGLTAPMAFAETPQASAERLEAFIDRFPQLEPGFAVVVVTPDAVLLERAWGEARASTGTPLTVDTPMYIASQTKAYLGLLAAILDERGILSLDSTIADHWPDIALPDGVDPAAWTMRDLLTHQVPISADRVTEIEAYMARIEAADYPALLGLYAQAREPGFEYDNLGPNIYGAILETVTGRSWQDWLDAELYDPLGLTLTSSRTSDFSLDQQSWNHTWLATEDDWLEVRPKTDAMMHSAGGTVTSPSDITDWLQLFLRGEGPAGSDITASAVATALTGYAQTHQEDRRNAYEMSCSHYALGWNVCEKNGHTLYIHGGGYTGSRSMMAVSPELGVGIAAFSNSDNMSGWVTSRVIDMYLQFLTDDPEAEAREAQRPDYYPTQIERLQGFIAQRQERARAEEVWGGWSWQPDADTLSGYVGRYETDTPYLTLEIAVRDGQLTGRIGDQSLYFEPAQPDLFGARTIPYDVPVETRFTRDDQGRITGLTRDGLVYRRVE